MMMMLMVVIEMMTGDEKIIELIDSHGNDD